MIIVVPICFVIILAFNCPTSFSLTYYSVETIAGDGAGYNNYHDGAPATSAWISSPHGIWGDTAGNIYSADQGSGRIRKFLADGSNASTIYRNAGNVEDIWIDSNSNYLYYTQSTQVIQINLVTAATSSYIPNIWNVGSLSGIYGDTKGNIYIASQGRCVIYKLAGSPIAPTGIVGMQDSCSYSTVANVRATSATLAAVRDVWIDSLGNLYVLNGYYVHKVNTTSGYVTSIVNPGITASYYFTGDGTNLYLPDVNADAVFLVPLSVFQDGLYSTYSPSRFGGVSYSSYPTCSFTGDGGTASSAKLCKPYSVFIDPAHLFLYIGDTSNNKIRKVTFNTGIITTFAGVGNLDYQGDQGIASKALLRFGQGLAFDPSNNLYIFDSGNCRIRKINSTTNIIRTFAGTGVCGSITNNALATSSQIGGYNDLFVDSQSSYLYFNDLSDYYVHRINLVTNIISRFAGSGSTTVGASGSPALSIGLGRPFSVWCNGLDGSCYVGSVFYIWKIANGIATIIAGSGTKTPINNGGDPLVAGMSTIYGVRVDTNSNLYFADFDNSLIRKISSSNIISQLVSSVKAYSLFLDLVSNQLFYTDSVPCTLKAYSLGTSTVTVIAGTGSCGTIYANDYVYATQFALFNLRSVTGDSNGNIYITEGQSSGSRVRKLSLYYSPSSQPSRQPTSQPSRRPTGQPTRQPSSKPSGQPTRNPSSQPTGQPSRSPSGQPTRVPLSLPTSQPSRQPTSQPISHPSNRPTSQPTVRPSVPTSQPSSCPSSQPASFPTIKPTMQPSSQPSSRPFSLPSGQPTNRPSRQPTSFPTSQPSRKPSSQPSSEPSVQPSGKPSSTPTEDPTNQPTGSPSAQPSREPTVQPTSRPSRFPTSSPTGSPSEQPTGCPSTCPSSQPSIAPSCQPSGCPSHLPSCIPSNQPTSIPSIIPSGRPSSQPSVLPTMQPSCRPTSQPSILPSSQPSGLPTSFPSSLPTIVPTVQPSGRPSCQPTVTPSRAPSSKPSGQPSGQPSVVPTTQPSCSPSCKPTNQPTSQPSCQPNAAPSRKPSSLPTNQPSDQPSKQPIGAPTSLPSEQPTVSPTDQPSSHPSTQPSVQPSTKPSQQPTTKPSSRPSSQPASSPTSLPSTQPTRRPTSQPSCVPSSQPSSQPTKNRMHCTVANNTFYSSFVDDCVKCPLHSFLNHTGEETCYCNGGFYQGGVGLSLNCTSCPLGATALPGDFNCTQCPAGSFADALSHTCEFCPVNFYSSSPGQTNCQPCPAGRTTVTVGSSSLGQCVSPIPNFTLGFVALFIVVVVFSWYIVFGKFQRVSFERRMTMVEPNIDKCLQVLVCEEEVHYKHLIGVQEKRNNQTSKFKFISFVLISLGLIIVSVLASFIYFTYQVFFTSLILWRGMKVDFKLSPILDLLTEALRGITQYIGFPVDVLFIVAIPFLYLFEALASIDLNLSTVNITCSGSQAPIELLINCFILGFLIIVVRSDYQLLFNVLLNNVNQRFLLNNLEQQLEERNFWFSRYFFLGLLFTGFIMINPFQVGLRYCMGFVRLDSFAKNHQVAHEVSESCDKVPGARHFDSFLGYTSTIFAWWLILPAIYCLAEVVVPKCKKIDPLTKIKAKSLSKKGSSKVMPAEFVIDGTVYSKKVDPMLCEPDRERDEEKDEENGISEMSVDEVSFSEDVRTPEFPNDLSAKFNGIDEKMIASIYQRGLREGVKIGEQKSMKYNKRSFIPVEDNAIEEPFEEKSSYVRKSIHKMTKRTPVLFAFYFYCQEKYFTMISIDLWISNAFASWIDFLKNNTSKKVQNDRLKDNKKHFDLASTKQLSVKRPGMKQLLSLDSEQFLQQMSVYDQAHLTKKRKLDNLWQREQHQNNHSLPTYYELSHVVQEELHEFVIQPFCSFLAFVGIGHFLTPTGRYYWNVVFHNYKVFLLVCLGIWTDEAVEAYDLEGKCIRLSVDDRSFLPRTEPLGEKRKEKPHSSVPSANPRGRKFSAQFLGFTINKDVEGNNGRDLQDSQNKDKEKRPPSGQQKQNMREVLPAIISILICSRVILFQIIPSLVLFATISMTLASFPLFIFSEFLAETLPPLIVWGKINREMSIERELKSFIPLDSETKQVLSERETMRMLTEEYSWRLSLRGIILFWNGSRLLQFVHSSLALFFSFLLLIYSPDLLIYLVVILALLVPFILSQSLVLLLYLGNSLDLKDNDFPKWCMRKRQKAKVEPETALAVANCAFPKEEEVPEEDGKDDIVSAISEETSVNDQNLQIDRDDCSSGFLWEQHTLTGYSNHSDDNQMEDSLADSWILSSSNTMKDSVERESV
jgi:hypothetical protein